MENFVALWSSSQQCFHVETCSEMVEKNRKAFANNVAVDYVPLFFGRDEDCRAFVDAIRERKAERAAHAKQQIKKFRSEIEA